MNKTVDDEEYEATRKEFLEKHRGDVCEIRCLIPTRLAKRLSAVIENFLENEQETLKHGST